MKMNLRLASTVAGIAVASILATSANAYTLLSPARRWFNAATPVQVNVDNGGIASVTGGDPDGGVTATVNAIRAWNANGVNVVTSSSGNVAYAQGDGVSDILFSDPLHLCTGSCLAATLTGYYSTSSTGTCGGLSVVKITDADVAFNLSYNYTTVAQGSCSSEIYLESVATHEVGHVIGLAHSNTSSALMYPSVSYCSNKPVGSDDLSGRNALYNCTLTEGGGGNCSPVGSSCSNNSDCCSNSCKGKPGGKTCK
jgi:hypothetical protein